SIASPLMRPDWRHTAIHTLGRGMEPLRISLAGSGESIARNFRYSPSIVHTSAALCGGSRSHTCLCVHAMAALSMRMDRTLPGRRLEDSLNTNTKSKTVSYGCGAASFPLSLTLYKCGCEELRNRAINHRL